MIQQRRLLEGEEVVGQVIEVCEDGVILKVLNHSVKILLHNDSTLQRLKELIGHKIGLLRYGQYNLRVLSEEKPQERTKSVFETPSIDIAKNKKMKHNLKRNCYNIKRSSVGIPDVSFYGHQGRGVSVG
ncbi:MAG: hypothetical protein DRN49_07160 [Thaumarchaeota archaeon]|nr:MAG: hypothetical protein DRN49_07160 [Nitrososphaerota archaeon]